MTLAASQYAAVLVSSLDKKPEMERVKIIRRFLLLLRKNRDLGRLHLILRKFERLWFSRKGLRKVAVASAAPLDSRTRSDIGRIFGKKLVVEEEVKPNLLAGIRLLIDDETLIDASASRRLNQLF